MHLPFTVMQVHEHDQSRVYSQVCQLAWVQVLYILANMSLHYCLVGACRIEKPSDMQHTCNQGLQFVS